MFTTSFLLHSFYAGTLPLMRAMPFPKGQERADVSQVQSIEAGRVKLASWD